MFLLLLSQSPNNCANLEFLRILDLKTIKTIKTIGILEFLK
ncbi:MAG: hypothetical protein PUB35_08055 [Campylobacteraceae bacterium]|nr:hypothetical protein [Campylobacteraceae bacterium]